MPPNSTEASPSGRHRKALSGAETSEFYGKEALQNVSVASMIPEGWKWYLPRLSHIQRLCIPEDLKAGGGGGGEKGGV